MKFKYTLAVLCVGAAVQAYCADPFTAVVDEIVLHSPSLAASRAEAAAKSLELAAENNLADPEVGFDYRWGSPAGTVNKWSLTVSQSFDWPGLYATRSKQSRAALSAMQSRIEAETQELRLQVRLALIDYVFALKQREALKDVQNNLDSIRMVTSQMFDAGEATVLDIHKLEFSDFDLSRKLAEAENNIELARQSIAALNGGKPLDLSAICEYPMAKLLTEEEYIDAALKSAPALDADRREIEAARLSLSAAKMAALPGFSLGYIHEGEGPEKFDGITASVSLPLFSWRHRSAAAVQGLEAAESTLRASEATIRAEVIDNYKHCRRDAEIIANYHGTFDTNQYLGLLQRTYQARQISALEYLMEVNYYLTARQDYNELLYHYQQSLANINKYI